MRTEGSLLIETPMIIFAAKYLLYVILAIAFAWFLRQPRARQKEVVIAGALMALIAFALARIASLSYVDPRPFVTDHVLPLFPHAADNGFPSDHALLGAVVSLTLFRYGRRIGSVLLFLTLCVGLARVAANVHHLIDVAGSFLIAFVAYAIVYFAILPAIRKSRRRAKQ
jgi:undecaprenyl-diphosphatase